MIIKPTLPLPSPDGLDLAADTFSAWQDLPEVRFVAVLQCDGLLEIQLDNYGTILLLAGMTQTFSKDISRCKYRSPIAQNIKVAWGSDVITSAPTGSTSPGGVTVQGPYPNFTPAPLNPTSPRFLTGGMLQSAGPNQGVSEPLSPAISQNGQQGGGYELAVGFDDKRGTININAGSGSFQSAQGYNWGKIVVYGMNPNAVLTLADGEGNPIPYTDARGTFCPTGNIYADGTYYVDMAGLLNFGGSLVGTGGVGIDYQLSRVGEAPIKITKPAGLRLYSDPAQKAYGAGYTQLVPGRAGFHVRVYGWSAGLATANDLQFFAVDGSGTYPVSAKGYGIVSGGEVDEPVFEGGPGQEVGVALSVGGNGSISLRYEYAPA